MATGGTRPIKPDWIIHIQDEPTVANGKPDFAEALEAGAVSSDDTIEFGAGAGFLKQVMGIQKLVFLRDTIFIPANDFFALVFQRQRQS